VGLQYGWQPTGTPQRFDHHPGGLLGERGLDCQERQ